MDGFLILVAVVHVGAASPHFDTRERFTLQSPSLAVFLAYSPDPEVRHRYAAQAQDWQWNHFRSTWDSRGWPWVDAFPELPWQGCDIPLLTGDDYPGWKEATRLWVRGELAKGAEPARLHAKLLEAEQRCDYWRQHKRYP